MRGEEGNDRLNQVRSDEDLAASIYLTHVDSQVLPSAPGFKVSPEHEELRATLVLYLLLANKVIIPDGAAIYNSVLRDLLFDERHAHFGLREHLRDGTLAFAQRSAAPSFREIDAFLRRDEAFGSDASGDIEPYLAFLEEAARARVPYDYDLTARTFTAGVEGSLEDQEITRALGLGEVGDGALDFMLRSRETSVEDGYSRRSFAYRYAQQLEGEGLAAHAEALRGLASSVYHGAAAATIGVNPAYAPPFRPAAAAIHAVGIDLPPEQVLGGRDSFEESLPFPAEALYLADAEVVREIRAGSAFKEFLDSARRTSAMADGRRAISEFADALSIYLATIEEPLTLLAGGRYESWKRFERRAKITRHASNVGVGVVALTGLLVPEASLELKAFGVAWGFGGWSIQRFLERRMQSEVGQAKARTRHEELVPQSSLPQAALRRS